MSERRLEAIVLAGDRGPGDPLSVGHGVPGKVLVPVEGRPLLAHVLDAVCDCPVVGTVAVAAPDRPGFAELLAQRPSVRRVAPADGPAASVQRALEALEGRRPVLVVTGDHPLLRAGWLEEFADRAAATGADAVVGVVSHALVQQAFPGSKRTRYRFRDLQVCGTNLFYLSDRAAADVAAVWRGFEADRKRPWRILRRLGPGVLFRYLLGRLDLDAAMRALSRRIGVEVRAVVLEWPEAAVDVDSPADLELVRDRMRRRNAESS
ncbi:MAG: nucleotidyltransferase family protein [Wenzhouxiangellaceae bacterium]|nr:nucleotidyltransferase family protein [Wenzhouxiangellaceae bacterium]